MHDKTSILVEQAMLKYFEASSSKRFTFPKAFGKKFHHFSIAKELGFKPEVVLLDVPFKILYKRSIKQINRHKVSYATFIRQLNAAAIINKHKPLQKVFNKLIRYLQKWHASQLKQARKYM